MSSRKGKTPPLGKAGFYKSYGATVDIESSRSSSSNNQNNRNPFQTSYEDPDEFDFAAWNPEQIPLLQRTIEQARSLGVKRTLSWVAGTGSDGNLQDLDQDDKKPWHVARKAKVFFLTLVCILIVVMLLFLPEENSNVNLITVQKSEEFIIDIDELYRQSRKSPSDNILNVWLKGSFLAPELESLARRKLKIMTIYDDNQGNETVIGQDIWTIGLLPDGIDDMFYMEKSILEKNFNLEGIDMQNDNVSLLFRTNSEEAVPLDVKLQLLSKRVDDGVIYGAIVLVALYICIILELAHRTVVAMLAATLGIAVLATLNERPTLEEIITWVDIETLTLLFSMMVIVSVLSETGAFNYLGFWAFKVTQGQIWPLLSTLCFITALVSAFLDNVTTILLMTPVVIQLCEAINVNPVRVLIATVIYSNIGGAATAIGDPPNVLIASDLDLQEAGVSFLNFTLHMSICTILVGLVCAIYVRIAYRNIDRHKEDKELHELKHEIIIWNRTLQFLSNFSREEAVVKEIIGLKINELRDEYDERVAEKGRTSSWSDGPSTIESMEEDCRITNKGLLVKSLAVLTVTVLLFFLQNIDSLNLSLGWTALLGAMTLLILADKAEVESLFARVEWTTLIFFAALFVLMESLARLGLLSAIGKGVEDLILAVPKDYQLMVAILLILWVSGIASAFIDNIPFTTMMIPVVKGLADNSAIDLPLQPLVWSLALGACLGGNGTLIGASANVVCAGVAEQHGYKFSFLDFFKVGFPLTILSLIVASGYLLICHIVFQWNY